MTEHRLEVADVFRQHKQEFFTRWGHTLSARQRKVFRDICACRTPALGARLEQCNHCYYQHTQFHSCRNRHCPKCQSTARDRWLARTARELLPVPYSHVVFTLPGSLSPLVLQNAKRMYDLLFRCVSETLLTIARDKRRLGADLGFLAVLHTWNQKMLHHPHLHCLVPAGGFSSDRSRWIRSRKRFFLPGPVLGKMFRGNDDATTRASSRARRVAGPTLPQSGLYLSAWIAKRARDSPSCILTPAPRLSRLVRSLVILGPPSGETRPRTLVRPARRRSSLLIITNVITGVQHLRSPNKSVWLNGSAVMDFSVSALRKLAGTARVSSEHCKS